MGATGAPPAPESTTRSIEDDDSPAGISDTEVEVNFEPTANEPTIPSAAPLADGSDPDAAPGADISGDAEGAGGLVASPGTEAASSSGLDPDSGSSELDPGSSSGSCTTCLLLPVLATAPVAATALTMLMLL